MKQFKRYANRCCSFKDSFNPCLGCDCRCLENTADNAQRTASIARAAAISSQQGTSAQRTGFAQKLAQCASSTAPGAAHCGTGELHSDTQSPSRQDERLATAGSSDTLTERENVHHATCHSGGSMLAACETSRSPTPPQNACMQVRFPTLSAALSHMYA